MSLNFITLRALSVVKLTPAKPQQAKMPVEFSCWGWMVLPGWKMEELFGGKRSIRKPRGLPEFFVFHQKCSGVTARLYLHVYHNVGFVFGSSVRVPQACSAQIINQWPSTAPHLLFTQLNSGLSPIAEVKTQIFSFWKFQPCRIIKSCYVGWVGFFLFTFLSIFRNIYCEIFPLWDVAAS